MTDSPANPTPDDRVTALWDLHFRDPEPAFAQAQALLAEPANVDARTRAWCELTIAFHHLFFTAHPLEARRWIAAATDSFAKTGERRGALLAEIGAARLAKKLRTLVWCSFEHRLKYRFNPIPPFSVNHDSRADRSRCHATVQPRFGGLPFSRHG